MISEPITSRKTITEIWYGNFEKRFSRTENMALSKIFRLFLYGEFFPVYIINKQLTSFFVVQF